jgi:hypothetical protein
MAERVSRERISREKGYLYYLGKDGYVWQNPTKSNKAGSKRKVGSDAVRREPGYLYFVDSEGYVSRTEQGRKKG